MRKVEDMQEYRDNKDLEHRISKLSNQAEVRIIQNIISQVCWHGPVTREWLEREVDDQERLEAGKPYTAEDHPIEDIFGSEIQTGDKWFQDSAGRIVLEDNAEDYLIEVAKVEFFREIK